LYANKLIVNAVVFKSIVYKVGAQAELAGQNN